MKPASISTPYAELVRMFNALLRGRTNNTGSVTLEAGTTSTVIFDPRITASSVITLSPGTGDAAGAVATTSIVCSTGQATISHSNSGSTVRTFGYVING
jgi:hypothetical protein